MEVGKSVIHHRGGGECHTPDPIVVCVCFKVNFVQHYIVQQQTICTCIYPLPAHIGSVGVGECHAPDSIVVCVCVCVLKLTLFNTI